MKTEIRSHSPGSGSWVSHYSVCHSFTCKSVQHAHVDVNYCTVLEIVPCWICFPKANRSKLFLEKQLVRFMYSTYPVTDHHQLICSLMHNSNSHITTHYECSMTEFTRLNSEKKKRPKPPPLRWSLSFGRLRWSLSFCRLRITGITIEQRFNPAMKGISRKWREHI